MAGAGVSRRALLGGLGVGGVGAAVGAVGAHTWQDEVAGRRCRTRAPGRSPSTASTRRGIATAAQDRLAFASFDVVTTDRGELRGPAAGVDRRRGRDDPWPARPGRLEPARGAAGRHRRDGGLAPAALTVTAGFGPSLFDEPLRPGPPPARRAAGPAAPARRRPRPRPLRRRPRDPGLRPRPPGRLPRHPQPGPHRPRRRRRCAGPSSASAARPPRRAPSRRRAT